MGNTINKIQIIGYLARDPEYRESVNGQPIAKLRVATNWEWKNQAGEKTTKTEYHKVVVFGNFAQNCWKVLKKGDRIYVEGVLQTSVWENSEKIKKHKTEIISRNIVFLNAKSMDCSEIPEDINLDDESLNL